MASCLITNNPEETAEQYQRVRSTSPTAPPSHSKARAC